MTLLDKFIDPELIKPLPWSETVLGTFYVIVAGMVITFAVLIIVWLFVILLSKVFGPQKGKGEAMSPVSIPSPPTLESKTEEDEVLAAVITAALSSSLQVSPHTIRVRNIVRMIDPTPSWGRMGRMEQLNQTL